MGKRKQFRTRPRHQYWFNGEYIEKVTAVTNSYSSNKYETISLKTNEFESSIIIGYILQPDAKKATKEDYERALANVL